VPPPPQTWFVEVGQTPSWQHGCVLPPQAPHVPLLQTYGSLQKSAPLPGAGQQRSPEPPHATHWPAPLHLANGAVQPMAPGQQPWPISPQVPPWHPPPVQVPPEPPLPVQVPVPPTTHVS